MKKCFSKKGKDGIGNLLYSGQYGYRQTWVGCPHANVAGAWSYDADGHTIVLPIPQDILNLNSNLSQNPGYLYLRNHD